MRYQKRVSAVYVVGKGCYGQTMVMSYELNDYALRNIAEHSHVTANIANGDERLPYNRDGVEQWLMLNSGDFQTVTDFRVTISDADGRDFDSDWQTEDGECAFNDCMYPEELEA